MYILLSYIHLWVKDKSIKYFLKYSKSYSQVKLFITSLHFTVLDNFVNIL